MTLNKVSLPGANKMHLNNATLIQIIQEWLDNRTSISGEVTNVERKDDYFVISIREKEFAPDCNDPEGGRHARPFPIS